MTPEQKDLLNFVKELVAFPDGIAILKNGDEVLVLTSNELDFIKSATIGKVLDIISNE
jgi:hypothetical protein